MALNLQKSKIPSRPLSLTEYVKFLRGHRDYVWNEMQKAEAEKKVEAGRLTASRFHPRQTFEALNRKVIELKHQHENISMAYNMANKHDREFGGQGDT